MSNFQIERILTEQSHSKLYTYLKKQSVDSLAIAVGHDPLDQLNPAVHSLGYLFILYAILLSLGFLTFLIHLHRKSRLERPAKSDSAASITERIALFLQDFNARQIKSAPTECKGSPAFLILLPHADVFVQFIVLCGILQLFVIVC